jgi:hypothetical protein
MASKKTKNKPKKDDKLKDVLNEISLTIKYKNDILKTIEYNRDYVKKEIKELPIKFRILAHIQYEKPGDFDDILQRWISTKQFELLIINDFDKRYDKAVQRLTEAIEEANLKGSGWSTGEVLELKLQTSKYNPIKGSS